MKYSKYIVYIPVIIITVGLGLFVRAKANWFPEVFNLYAGDALYAFMMHYIVCLFTNKTPLYKAVIALLICYVIEFSQLYQAEWINTIRQTPPGKLVLGSGFLYSDLLAYLIGITLAFLSDYFLLSHKFKR
ncbi:putative membrane protein YjgA [Flavobacterium suaedae]|uniref:Membrane protein YjgA n=1 Tax=Flavobacterium suaedae TaxID=1767027 RepID=A0ABQ1JG98_9FLAO|nr:DUF2809 domain-containing protein [Flavobacterium suaedae]GGB65271.1 putative membrane protein YjgA [Flavobacterium suaedae]